MLQRYTMRIQSADGFIRQKTVTDAPSTQEYLEELRGMVFDYIGARYIFDDFTPCTLEFRISSTELHSKRFDSLEEMKNYYILALMP